MSIPNPLRSITVRLNTTPVEELPRYARFLASALSDCANVLQKAESQKGDAAVLLHKLKTRITSLLQDKTTEGRFTGIVLTKAVVEAGGPQTIATSAIWVRAMLSCLNKQDPPEVKKLCLITLTRIFLLTDGLPTLIREITTPTLPTFIQTTLALIKPPAVPKGKLQNAIPSALLQSVLQCWHQLLLSFASTFRPFVAQIKTIVVEAIGNEYLSTSTKALAKNVLVTLHFAAPKNTASMEWLHLCQQITDSTHGVADRIFRSIIEEWTSVNSRPPPRMSDIVSDDVGSDKIDATGFGSWTGLQSGCSRAVELFRLLQLMLTSKQFSAVELPLASVLDLTARFVAVIPNTAQYQLRTRPEIGRDEREEMWLQLPHLHAAVLDLLEGVIATFGPLLKPVMSIVAAQLLAVFEATAASTEVRSRVYCTLRIILSHGRHVLGSTESTTLASVARSCCVDLKTDSPSGPEQRATETTNGTGSSANMNLGSQSGALSTKRLGDVQSTEIHEAAWDLLPCIFQFASQNLTAKSRSELEATAIVCGHDEAMLSSVLHPSKGRVGGKVTSSIIPFLARADSGNLAFEALTRPRMPVIQTVRPGGPHEAEEGTDDEGTDQIEEQLTLDQHGEDPSVDVQVGADGLVKKRDFTEFEGEKPQDMDNETEASKRPRTILTPSQNVDPVPAELHDSTGMVADIIESLDEGNSPDPAVALLPLAATPTTQTTADSNTFSATVQPLRMQSIVDDSDDDEIPTIDATLTSESEDEDEDEEMDD